MKSSCIFHVMCFCITIMVSTVSRAELIDRGNGLIYDTVQDLTWTQNARMFYGTQSEAMAWAENLVYGGFDDWRLPTTARFDDPTCSPDARNGVNYSLFYEHRLDCTGGEMELLTALYDPWNNDLFKYVDGSGKVQRYIDRSRYWTSTPYRDGIDPCIYYPDYDVPCNLSGDNGDRTGFYWQYGFTGYDGVYNGLPFKTTLSGGIDRNAWAVRDGDVIPSILPGDINFDDQVDIADYLMLTQFVLGIRADPTPDELSAGDMNQNNQLDTGDLVIHLRTVLGEI